MRSTQLKPASRSAMRPRGRLAAAAAIAGALVAGCGMSSAAPAGPGHGPVTVTARYLKQVGTVLVDARGQALYMFTLDSPQSVTCTGVCAATWPPLTVPAGSHPMAGQGVSAALLGSAPDPSGGRVVTYDGWPLYTYTGDSQPGQTTGQGIDLNGGDWYLMRPSGHPLGAG